LETNAQMGTHEIKRYCNVKDDAEKLLETAIIKVGLSARAMLFQTKCNPGRWPWLF
jgi:predicted ATPase with chaperone activity